MRVLCLDAEGGYGGSSRSLFESIRQLHKDAEIEVWCRKDGPIKPSYDALGVPCRIMPSMPATSAVPRFSRNVYSFARFAANWHRSRGFRDELLTVSRTRFDLVHFNLEALFWLMRWMRARLDSYPMTMHIRTTQPSNIFTRWQFFSAAANANKLIFITEENRRMIDEMAGRKVEGTDIYNIVNVPENVTPLAEFAADPRFKIAVLSNYDYMRGLDRLVDVARLLAARGRRDVVFIVAGKMDISRSDPGELGRIGRRGGTLVDYAAEMGVADMFCFLGHVADPYPVLAVCDLLAKPTREYNPWGRDILEGLGFGRPVITIGTYDRFVESGVTGLLYPEFDAAQWADDIIRLADDRSIGRRLGAAAQARIADLCNGPARAHDLLKVWQSACGLS